MSNPLSVTLRHPKVLTATSDTHPAEPSHSVLTLLCCMGRFLGNNEHQEQKILCEGNSETET